VLPPGADAVHTPEAILARAVRQVRSAVALYRISHEGRSNIHKDVMGFGRMGSAASRAAPSASGYSDRAGERRGLPASTSL
jgi:hypothetical protein